MDWGHREDLHMFSISHGLEPTIFSQTDFKPFFPNPNTIAAEKSAFSMNCPNIVLIDTRPNSL